MNEATTTSLRFVFYQANLFIRAAALGFIPKCLPNTGMDSPSVTAGLTKEKAVCHTHRVWAWPPNTGLLPSVRSSGFKSLLRNHLLQEAAHHCFHFLRLSLNNLDLSLHLSSAQHGAAWRLELCSDGFPKPPSPDKTVGDRTMTWAA